MKKSKYVNKQFGNWTCVGIEVARVQPVYQKGTKIRVAYPHHQHYNYVFQTKNGLSIRLESTSATKVYRGERTVESFIPNKTEVIIRYK